DAERAGTVEIVQRGECDVTPVRRDRRVETVVHVKLMAGTVGRGERRGPGLQVLDEDVGRTVEVALDEIAGCARERHEPSISCDGRRAAIAVGFTTKAVGGGTNGRAGREILDEHIRQE